MKRMDPWKVLGISSSASTNEVRNAYRQSVMRTHPDRGGSRDEFEEIQRAYAIIAQRPNNVESISLVSNNSTGLVLFRKEALRRSFGVNTANTRCWDERKRSPNNSSFEDVLEHAVAEMTSLLAS
jgi:hypothetical protein